MKRKSWSRMIVISNTHFSYPWRTMYLQLPWIKILEKATKIHVFNQSIRKDCNEWTYTSVRSKYHHYHHMEIRDNFINMARILSNFSFPGDLEVLLTRTQLSEQNGELRHLMMLTTILGWSDSTFDVSVHIRTVSSTFSRFLPTLGCFVHFDMAPSFWFLPHLCLDGCDRLWRLYLRLSRPFLNGTVLSFLLNYGRFHPTYVDCV